MVNRELNRGIWLDPIAFKKRKKYIYQSYQGGVRSFLLSYDASSLSLLKHLPATQIYLISPDATRYVREMTQYGMMGMALRTIQSLGLWNLGRLLPYVVRYAFHLKAKDFRVLVPLLVQVEYFQSKKFRPRILFLHYQITDLALANNAQQIITNFLRLGKGCPGTTLGLMTKNFSLLEQRIEEWKLKVPVVLAPFNRKGLGMRISKKECEQIVQSQGRVYMSFGKVRKRYLPEEIAYLRKIGLRHSFLTVEEIE